MIHRHARQHWAAGLFALSIAAIGSLACQESKGIPGPPPPPPASWTGLSPVVARPTPVQKSVTGYREAKFEAAVQKGVVYGLGNVTSGAGTPGLKALRMDVYTPTGHDAQDKPAAVILAPGGDGEAIARYLATRGFVACAAQVRGAEDNAPQPDIAPVIDAKAALRWLHAHAVKLGVSERRIAIVGVGAGGAIASKTALSDPEMITKDPPASSGFDQNQMHPFNSLDASAFVRAAVTVGGGGGAAPSADGPAMLQTDGSGDAAGEKVLDFLVKSMVEDKTYFYQLNVKPDPNGKTNLAPGGGFYREGTNVSLSAEAVPGYRFVEWSGGGKNYPAGAAFTIGSDMDLTAHFQPQEPQSFAAIDVKVQGQGKVELDPPGGKYLKNTWVRIYKLPAPGWQHLAVPPAIPQHLDYLDVLADRNNSVTVIFQQAAGGSYTLETSADGDGTIALDPPGGSYPAGTVVTATAKPGAGKSFAWWAGDTRQTGDKALIVMDANKKLMAGFAGQ